MNNGLTIDMDLLFHRGFKNNFEGFMEKDEIKQAEQQLARLFFSYIGQIYEEGNNEGLAFKDFIKKPMYLAAMRYCNGNQAKAAKCLGVSRVIVRNNLKEYFGTTKVGNKFTT